MNKINIILFAIFISLIELAAFGEEISKPAIKFDAINSFISCKVDIAPLKIKSGIVKSLGCYQSTEVGKPALPVYSFFVLLPPNTTIKNLTITKIEQIKLDGKYDVRVVLPPIPISNSKTKALHSMYSDEETIYPEDIVKINSIQGLRGYTLACISVFGACYEAKTKQLTWNKQISFNLNLITSKAKSTTFRGLKEDKKLINELVVNPELTSFYGLRIKPLELPATYTYVIITHGSLTNAFKPLINQRGLNGTIATTQWIYDTYFDKGVDEQERIKAFIKNYYETYGTCYVLLGGDVDIIPYRGVYAKVIDGALNTKEYVDDDIPCDLYYACLDNDWDWDTDEDNIYGKLNEDEIDLMPEVWIGRAPVNTPKEATDFVDKVLNAQASLDNYIYNILLIASMLDNKGNDGKEILEDVAIQIPATYTLHKEYESEGGGYKDSIIQHLNSGVGFVAHVGHAFYNVLELRYGVDALYINDIKGLTNGTKTFIFNSIGCLAGAFDNSICIGEEMVVGSNSWAAAFIGNSSYGFYDKTNLKLYSGEYQIEFFKKLFKEGYTHIGKTLALSKMEFVSRCNAHDPYRWIMFCLNLLGDPAMEFRSVKEVFCVDYIIDKVIDKPGKVVDLIVTLKNLKNGTITGIVGTLTTTDQYITIVKDTATFGNISPNGTVTNLNDPYQIIVHSNCPLVHKVNFLIRITGHENYKNMDKFYVNINLKADNLDKVIHYPNPCYPDEGDILKIVNIPLNSNPKVYIYNLAGELVRTLDEEGVEIIKYPASEEVFWDAKNDSGENVAFGVYIYILKCDLGTKKGKIAIIR
jgi:hypothetical protein